MLVMRKMFGRFSDLLVPILAGSARLLYRVRDLESTNKEA
jgi:hypothetical protein